MDAESVRICLEIAANAAAVLTSFCIVVRWLWKWRRPADGKDASQRAS